MKLTKKTVEKLDLPKKGQSLIWDSDLKGFGIRLTPAGRVYIVQARVNGVSRRISLGKHGIITADEARKKAQVELGKMTNGIDPVIEKRRKEALSLTLSRLRDEYLENRKELKERSRVDINRHIESNFSSWLMKPVTDITREKVLTKFQELYKRGPVQANQAFRILRALLNFAMAAHRPDDTPILTENPVNILSQTKVWAKVKPRTGRIPTSKIGSAWNALQEMRETPAQTASSRTAADVVTFLLLTGARWGEASQLTWDRVNLGEKWWFLPDPKNRNPIIFPLSDLAAEVLAARERKGAYVFPARSGGGHIKDIRGTVDKVGKGVEARITPHDLRRSFRAVAGECGIELWKTKLLMGHKLSGDITITHYTETSDLRYLNEEINKIAQWIAEHGAIAAAAGKVLPFVSADQL